MDLRKLSGFRLIDVDTLNIVPATSLAPYVALSYVWGHVPKPECTWLSLRSTGLNDLPATVAGAIRVTKQIGQRFLRIDRFCIEQNDSQDTKAQIENMRQIYAQAYFTIIAISGHSAHSGLPGVNPENPRRIQQTSAIVDGKHYIARRIVDIDSFVNSRWNSRGWTMQEALSPVDAFVSQMMKCSCGADPIHIAKSSKTDQLNVRSYQFWKRRSKSRQSFPCA